MVVVGGLAISQITTLYVTPVFYTYLDELQAWLGVRVPTRVPATPTPDIPTIGGPIPLPAPSGD